MNEMIKNKKKSELLAERIAAMEFGEMITHSDIAAIIDEAYPSNKYNTTVQKAKKLLLTNYHRSIECVVGDGYRLVKPDDFVNHALRHYKRGFKELSKGEQTLEHAPVAGMTQEGLQTYRRVYDRAVILSASLQGASVEIKTLASKKPHPFALAAAKQ